MLLFIIKVIIFPKQEWHDKQAFVRFPIRLPMSERWSSSQDSVLQCSTTHNNASRLQLQGRTTIMLQYYFEISILCLSENIKTVGTAAVTAGDGVTAPGQIIWHHGDTLPSELLPNLESKLKANSNSWKFSLKEIRIEIIFQKKNSFDCISMNISCANTSDDDLIPR